jgi:1L-myo-inositol 1-phosphate cytidylyltransferase
MAPLAPSSDPVVSGEARMAVILAAGDGERMSGFTRRPKPLLELEGLLLVERTILCLHRAGVQRFRVVVNGHAVAIGEALRTRPRLASLDVALVPCARARIGNGLSLAAGAGGLAEPFLLCMSDHVFDPEIARRLQAQGARDPERVQLATDGALARVFDLDDATKVRVDRDAVQALGKALAAYSRVDVGLFYCPAWVGPLAAGAVEAGARSVSEVMQGAIARQGLRSCPVEPLFWQDVDTPAMLQEARRRLREAGDPLGGAAAPVRLVLPGVGMVVALALFGWVLTRQPLAAIAAVVSPLEWSALALLAFPLLWYASNTVALWLLIGRRVKLPALFLNRVAADGLNLLLPLGGLGGEPLRARHLARWLPGQEAAAAVIAGRLVDELSAVTFAGVCLVVAGQVPLPGRLRGPGTILGIALILLGPSLALLLTGRAPARLAAAVFRLLRRGGRFPLAGPLGVRPLLGAFAFHLVGRAAGLLEVLFLLHLLGIAATARAAAGVTALLLVSGAATLVFPQGLGVLEAASVLALGLLGQPPPVGVAFGLLRRGRMLVYGAVGSALGLLVLRPRPGPSGGPR